MYLPQYLLSISIARQHISPRKKPMIGYPRWINPQESILIRCRRDRLLELPLAIHNLSIGVNPHSDIEPAPGRYIRSPITALNPADHKIKRVIELPKGNVFVCIHFDSSSWSASMIG